MLPDLTLAILKQSAREYAQTLSRLQVTELFGVSDGKAIGTYIEQQFRRFLSERYAFTPGNSASGLDFPALLVDLKTTSVTQPQSSSPFRNADQKVYGLGYHVLVMVYNKTDDLALQAARLRIADLLFVDRRRTGDWTTTTGLIALLDRGGSVADIVAFLQQRQFPLEDDGLRALAERILRERPEVGYLTVSNALQWRLQYARALTAAEAVEGVERL